MSEINKIRRKKITLPEGVLDKERTLKYTLDAYAEMEERYGSVDTALEMFAQRNMKAAIFILWCGLKHEDDDLTEKQVGRMIDARDLPLCFAQITKAVEADGPQPNEEEVSPN